MTSRTRGVEACRTLVASTGGPAFAADSRGRILFWNEGAERAVGLRAEEVVGRRCHEVIHGSDCRGNPFCRPGCNITWAVRHGEPVFPVAVSIRTPNGVRAVEVSTVVFPGERASDYLLIHLLRLADDLGEVAPEDLLTRREIHVLRLLGSGAVVKDIAESLRLCEATVRTHVASVLRKLGAHRQAEAIAIAFRRRII